MTRWVSILTCVRYHDANLSARLFATEASILTIVSLTIADTFIHLSSLANSTFAFHPSYQAYPKPQASDLVFSAISVTLAVKDEVLGSFVENSIRRYVGCALSNGDIIDAAFGFHHLKLPGTEHLSISHWAPATMNLGRLNPHPSRHRLNARARFDYIDPIVAPADKSATVPELSDLVAVWICASLLRACGRNEARFFGEADGLDLLDCVSEVHVHAMLSDNTQVDGGKVLGAAEGSHDHVGTIGLELWSGALACGVHCW